jgi:hypothetical protein
VRAGTRESGSEIFAGLALEKREGLGQSLLESDFRFPAEQSAGFGDVGAAAGRVVLWKRLKAEFAW